MPIRMQHLLRELVKVAADVCRLGRGEVCVHSSSVYRGDGADVGFAHDGLAEILDAVFCWLMMSV